MKPDVTAFIESIVSDDGNRAYQHQLKPLVNWAGPMDTSPDAIETNLSIGRLISCASARVKRGRTDADLLKEKSGAGGGLQAQGRSRRNLQLKTAKCAKKRAHLALRGAENMQKLLAELLTGWSRSRAI